MPSRISLSREESLPAGSNSVWPSTRASGDVLWFSLINCSSGTSRLVAMLARVSPLRTVYGRT